MLLTGLVAPIPEKFFFHDAKSESQKVKTQQQTCFSFFWGLKVSVLECSSILPAKTFPQCTIILLAAPLSFFCPITGYAVAVFCNVAVRNKTARALHPLGIPYFWGKDSNLKNHTGLKLKRSCIFFLWKTYIIETECLFATHHSKYTA